MSSSKRRAFVDCLTYHRTTGIAGALASVLLVTSLPAVGEPATNAGHAIANRFAEDAQRAEAAKEAKRKEAARKQAQQRKEEAARAATAKSQKAHESEMLARARTEAEERRKLEEAATRLDAIRAEREARDAEAERQRALKARQIEAAREAEQMRVAEEARKTEEARKAAETSRIAAEEARKAEEARRVDMTRKAEEETKRAEAERLAAEARRVEQAAWAAEEKRRAEEARLAEVARKVEEIRKANEALRVAAERAAAEEAQRAEADKHAAQVRRDVERTTADEARRVADIEADAEIARVAERLKRIREEHLAQRTAGAEPVPVASTTAERILEPTSGRGRIVDNDGFRDVPLQPRAGTAPQVPSHYGQAPSNYSSDPKLPFDGRVTVLLQMEPRYRRGRRYESMDPVLCTSGGCYVSNGPSASASFIHGRGAMRFGNAIGRRAGACNGDTTCVFRDVDLGGLPADVQPVDIRVIRHDRREPERVDVLSHCRTTANDRLTCTGAIEGDGYTMWVISEDEAERVPPHAFERVLVTGLADAERAEADPKLMAPRGRW